MSLKRNVEVDCGAHGRVTEGIPVWRDHIPGVLDTYVVPRSCERRCEVGEGRGGEDREDREDIDPELVAAHD